MYCKARNTLILFDPTNCRLKWSSWVICNGTHEQFAMELSIGAILILKRKTLNHCIWLLKVRKMLSFILLVTVKIRHKFVFLQKFTYYTSLGVVTMSDTIAHDDLDFVQWKIVLFWCQTCANDSRNFMIKKKKYEPWCVFQIKFVKNRVNFLLSFGFFITLSSHSKDIIPWNNHWNYEEKKSTKFFDVD